jgi:hypothetical protein
MAAMLSVIATSSSSSFNTVRHFIFLKRPPGYPLLLPVLFMDSKNPSLQAPIVKSETDSKRLTNARGDCGFGVSGGTPSLGVVM